MNKFKLSLLTLAVCIATSGEAFAAFNAAGSGSVGFGVAFGNGSSVAMEGGIAIGGGDLNQVQLLRRLSVMTPMLPKRELLLLEPRLMQQLELA